MTNWYDTFVTNVNSSISAVYLKKSDVIDNLTTNNTDKILSAKQGKILYEMIE